MKKRLSKQLLVLTTEEEHKFVKDLSNKLDLSMGQVIRYLIKKQRIAEETNDKENILMSL